MGTVFRMQAGHRVWIIFQKFGTVFGKRGISPSGGASQVLTQQKRCLGAGKGTGTGTC